MVRMSLEGMDESVLALVDSGAERTLVAPWVGRLLGLYPSEDAPKIMLGMGGETLPTAFYQATVRLHAPEPHAMETISWETHIGVPTSWRAPVWNAILGQVGLFDHFTITMQRHARMLAVEAFEAFDERFLRDD